MTFCDMKILNTHTKFVFNWKLNFLMNFSFNLNWFLQLFPPIFIRIISNETFEGTEPLFWKSKVFWENNFFTSYLYIHWHNLIFVCGILFGIYMPWMTRFIIDKLQFWGQPLFVCPNLQVKYLISMIFFLHEFPAAFVKTIRRNGCKILVLNVQIL